MFKKPVWDDLSFVTWCIILLEVALRRWVHCSHKGMSIGQQQYSGRLWSLNNAQLVLRGPKCVKKISPTPLHLHHQPEPLRQGRMDPCFHVLYAKFWPCHLNVAAEIETHHRRQRFSNLVLSNFWWACANCSLSFLFLAPGVVFCCCSPSASEFDVLCIQRWYSAYLGCNEWLFELLLPFCHL